jgi:hypothetical protein
VTPEAERPTEANWKVVATLRHRPGLPTVVQVASPATPVDVEAWSRSEGWCEHCRTRRPRALTYLLRSNSGRLVQVGSGCLPALLAGAGPVLLRKRPAGSRRRSPSTFAQSESAARYIRTQTFLAHVAQSALDNGFVPASASTRERPATWKRALATLESKRSPSTRAYRRAAEALSWVRLELAATERLNDFERSLVQITSRDRLTRRELSTAGAAIYVYHRHLRRAIASRRTTSR